MWLLGWTIFVASRNWFGVLESSHHDEYFVEGVGVTDAGSLLLGDAGDGEDESNSAVWREDFIPWVGDGVVSG
jgi:hypothetical protein